MQAQFGQAKPHHRGVCGDRFASVVGEQGQRLTAARIRVEHLDRLAPSLRLGRIDLAQIQNVPLHHSATIEATPLSSDRKYWCVGRGVNRRPHLTPASRMRGGEH